MTDNPTTTSTTADQLGTKWLDDYIAAAIAKNLCTKMNCTTCGAMDFRKGLLRANGHVTQIPTDGRFNTRAAQSIAEALSCITNRHDGDWVSAIRLIILDLNQVLGTPAIKEMLGESWAGKVLEDMQEHYQRNMGRNREHAQRQDPEFIKKYREEKRAKRQAQHEERLEARRLRGRKFLSSLSEEQ